eukprot:TRINITY_DN928_c0_g1_i2.p1 TRINITY_DN928_c0_g1~~TRINITY_DN928_c0_g1_i2.p1  ORF type:complete len:281 (+),score=55.62 TRINITY_DN928_c0_g1_i2:52-894(+)
MADQRLLVPPPVKKPKLSKTQKAEKYGKKYKKGFLEFNKEWLGGDMSLLKEHAEAEAKLTEKLMLKREASDPIRIAWEQKRKLRIKDNIGEIEDKTITGRVIRQKLKGYVTLVTSSGEVNLLLHCDIAPLACENFLGLSRSGYYNNTKFHRLIAGFMVQGGDPSGTGAGGRSFWGDEPFPDEIPTPLSHNKRGILALANSGPNTNKSQFYITFAPCEHLDSKHTVFGEVVGGMSVLLKIEQTQTKPPRDEPVNDITLIRSVAKWDPFHFFETEKTTNEED